MTDFELKVIGAGVVCIVATGILARWLVKKAGKHS